MGSSAFTNNAVLVAGYNGFSNATTGLCKYNAGTSSQGVVGYNGLEVFNVTAFAAQGAGAGNLQLQTGFDVTANALFADPTLRNLAWWGGTVAGGGVATPTAAINKLLTNPTLLTRSPDGLLYSVRAGYITHQPLYKSASYPNDPSTVDANGNPWPGSPGIGPMGYQLANAVSGWIFVNGSGTTSSAGLGSIGLNLPWTSTSGNLLVVEAANYSSNLSAVIDNYNNTYYRVGSNSNGTGAHIDLWFTLIQNNGIISVTGQSQSFGVISANEFIPPKPYVSTDGSTATAIGAGTGLSVGNINMYTPNLVVAGFAEAAGNSTFAAANGFTLGYNVGYNGVHVGSAFEYNLLANSSSINPSITLATGGSQTLAGVGAAFISMTLPSLGGSVLFYSSIGGSFIAGPGFTL